MQQEPAAEVLEHASNVAPQPPPPATCGGGNNGIVKPLDALKQENETLKARLGHLSHDCCLVRLMVWGYHHLMSLPQVELLNARQQLKVLQQGAERHASDVVSNP